MSLNKIFKKIIFFLKNLMRVNYMSRRKILNTQIDNMFFLKFTIEDLFIFVPLEIKYKRVHQKYITGFYRI